MLSILIVEDEPVVALDLQHILAEAGHSVVGIARSMSQALSIAGRFPLIDLAIMDMHLVDGANGAEAAEHLRRHHGIRSLFVSADIDEAVRAQAALWGAAGFVGKPYAPDEILRAVDRL